MRIFKITLILCMSMFIMFMSSCFVKKKDVGCTGEDCVSQDSSNDNNNTNNTDNTDNQGGNQNNGNKPQSKNQLLKGQKLNKGNYIESSNGQYQFKVENSGNLTLKNLNNNQTLWSSNTSSQSESYLSMQGDGNLVLYSNSKALWASGTVGSGNTNLILNNNGVLSLVRNNQEIWKRPDSGQNDNPTDNPNNDPSTSWKFIIYGDTRTERDTPHDDSNHRSVLRSIRKNTPDYKFIINVGDVIQSGTQTSQWETWKDSVNDLLGGMNQNSNPPKYMAAPGNHEALGSPSGLANWKKYLPGQQRYGNNGKFFYFDYKNARFIVLNSVDGITGTQYTMLKNKIKSNTKEWLFTVWHHPIFDFGPKEYEDNLHDKWGVLLYNGGADIMFVGHAHYYVRSKKLKLNGTKNPPIDNNAGVVHLVTGNGGAPIYKVKPNEDNNQYMVEKHFGSFGYTELTVTGNQLRLKHIDTNGTVIDNKTYTANKKNNSSNNDNTDNDGGGIPDSEANSNFQVRIDNKWLGVCCDSSKKIAVISSQNCSWKESGRVLTDNTNSLSLDCPENNQKPVNCTCSSSGERFHGAPSGPVSSSIFLLPNGAPIFPNIGRETCVYVTSGGEFKSRSTTSGDNWNKGGDGWPDKDCPHFRMLK